MGAIADREKATAPHRSTEVRQREIIAAVLELAAERGVEAITTQAVADRVGLSQAAVFRHFPTKEAIWAAVLNWLRQRLGEMYNGDHEARPMAELARIFAAYLDLIGHYPALPRLVFSNAFHHAYPVLHEEVRQIVLSCRARIGGLVAMAQKDGEVRRDVIPEAAAAMFISIIQGLALQSTIIGLTEDLPHEGAALFDLYTAALRL